MTLDKNLTHILSYNFGIPCEDNQLSRLPSSKLLMKEYFRRMSLWAKELGADKHWPFIPITHYIDPDIQLDDKTNLKIRQAKLPSVYMTIICRYHLLWEQIKNTGKVIGYELPEPYAPIILMIKRGTSFRREENMIDLSDWCHHPTTLYLFRSEYDWEEKFVELDEETLDAIDREAFESSEKFP